MQPVIDEAIVACRLVGGGHSRRVCRNTRYALLRQTRVDFGGEPGFMPGIENDISVETPAQLAKKTSCGRIEGKPWRQLHEDRPPFVPEAGGFTEKLINQTIGLNKTQFVRYRFRQLDREPEVIRNRRCPALVSREAVRTIEARVDLDAVENGSIPLQVAADVGKL